MKKVLYMYGGPEFHSSRKVGELLSRLMVGDGRFHLEMTDELNAFASLDEGKFDAVVVYTTGFRDGLTAEREKGLLNFIRNGGGFVGIHSASDSFRGSRAYIEMLGCEFLTHSPFNDFKVNIEDKDHYITTRMNDFYISDEIYHLKNYDSSKVKLLASAVWQGKSMPIAYAKRYGKGKVVYLANGHDLRAWNNAEFQKLVIRSIAWVTGYKKSERNVKCGIVGYGPSFNMGRNHARWINATEGMETIAVCDVNPERIKAAKEELPGLKGYFTDIDEMLKMEELDLVVVVLPHNLHAPVGLKCLEAGKNVVVEKPMCLTVKQADDMIEMAQKRAVMLSVFHNRRWDPDYITIRDIIARGLIGEVFHIECFAGNYSHPGFWWRSDKAVSGGIMYDWGAHFLDWILCMVNSEVVSVMGDLQKRVWHSVTNEDHGQVYMRFKNGVTAEFMISNIAAVNKPKWLILGTKGSVVLNEGPEQPIMLTSLTGGIWHEGQVKIVMPQNTWVQYYRNIADHLLMGEELIVKPEQARDVIAMIEAVSKSSELGRSVSLNG